MKKVSILLVVVLSCLMLVNCDSTQDCYTAKVVGYDRETDIVKAVLLSSPDDAGEKGFPTYQSDVNTFITFNASDLSGHTLKKDEIFSFLIKKCEQPEYVFTDAIYWTCEIEPY